MTELHWLSAVEAVKLIKTKKLSPVELTDALIKRIDKYDKHFNTFISFRPEQALKEARTAEEGVMKGSGVRKDHQLALELLREVHVVVAVELLHGRGVHAERVLELHHEVHGPLAIVEIVQIPGQVRIFRNVGLHLCFFHAHIFLHVKRTAAEFISD